MSLSESDAQKAVKHQRRLWFTYVNAKNEHSEREFDPYHLDGALLRGWDYLDKSMRCFRIDRIAKWKDVGWFQHEIGIEKMCEKSAEYMNNRKKTTWIPPAESHQTESKPYVVTRCPTAKCNFYGPCAKVNKFQISIFVVLLLLGIIPGIWYALVANGYFLKCPECKKYFNDPDVESNE